MELKLHTRSKSEDGSAQAKTLLEAVVAADTVVLGTLTKVREQSSCGLAGLLDRCCTQLILCQSKTVPGSLPASQQIQSLRMW